jgi:Leucine-rich repeat (LRR) protein
MSYITLKGKQIKILNDVLDLSEKQLENLDEIEGFDDIEYLEVIDLGHNQIEDLSCLSKLPKVNTLWLHDNNLTTLKGIEKLKEVKSLIITFNQISKVEIVNTINGLEELNLSANKIEKIQGLEKLSGLKTLVLMENKIDKINKIGGLVALTDLEVLRLDSNLISTLKGIPELDNLKDFSVSENNTLTNIKTVELLKNLKRLNLSKCKITDISKIRNLKELEELYLYSNEIVDIDPLTDLENLEKLYLFNNKIKNMVDLSKSIKLKNINLGDNKITNISGLSSLKNLEELGLYKNKIQKIEDLGELVKLKYLYLNNNEIQEIEGLENLASLNSLILAENRIKKIERLDDNYNLEILILVKNEIEKIEGLEGLTNLNELILTENRITKIEGIESLSNLNMLNLRNNNLEDTRDILLLKDIVIVEIDFYTFHLFPELAEERNKICEILEKIFNMKKQDLQYWKESVYENQDSIIPPIEDMINISWILTNISEEDKKKEFSNNIQQLIDRRITYFNDIKQIYLFLGLKYAMLSGIEQNCDILLNYSKICAEYFKKIDIEYCKFISAILNLYLIFLRSKEYGFIFGTIEEHVDNIIKLNDQYKSLQLSIIERDFEEFKDNLPQIKETFLGSDNDKLDIQNITEELKNIIIKELFNVPTQLPIISRIIIKLVYELNKKWETLFPYDYIKELEKIIISSKETGVLILGQDTSEMYRLERIKECLNSLGYHGIIIKKTDFEVISQTLEEKVSTLANLAKFIIIENSFASGHLTELKICEQGKWTTALLQEEGKGASYMTAAIDFQTNYIKEFDYNTVEQICDTIKEAVNWAEDFNRKKINHLNKIYPWRKNKEV